jgi:hypothetical protein
MPDLSPPETVPALVQAFERAAISRDRWTHDAHLTVAAWYLMRYPAAQALGRIRNGIQRLNAANRVLQTPTGGYHETLTRFYIWAVGQALAGLPPETSVETGVHTVLTRCRDRRLPLVYYSEPVLMSWNARTGWVQPDRRPLDSLVSFP